MVKALEYLRGGTTSGPVVEGSHTKSSCAKSFLRILVALSLGEVCFVVMAHVAITLEALYTQGIYLGLFPATEIGDAFLKRLRDYIRNTSNASGKMQKFLYAFKLWIRTLILLFLPALLYVVGIYLSRTYYLPGESTLMSYGLVTSETLVAPGYKSWGKRPIPDWFGDAVTIVGDSNRKKRSAGGLTPSERRKKRLDEKLQGRSGGAEKGASENKTPVEVLINERQEELLRELKRGMIAGEYHPQILIECLRNARALTTSRANHTTNTTMRTPPEEQADSSGLKLEKINNIEEVRENPNVQKMTNENETTPGDYDSSGEAEENLSGGEELSGYNKELRDTVNIIVSKIVYVSLYAFVLLLVIFLTSCCALEYRRIRGLAPAPQTQGPAIPDVLLNELNPLGLSRGRTEPEGRTNYGNPGASEETPFARGSYRASTGNGVGPTRIWRAAGNPTSGIAFNDEDRALPPPPFLPKKCGYTGLSSKDPVVEELSSPVFKEGYYVDSNGDYHEQKGLFEEIGLSG